MVPAGSGRAHAGDPAKARNGGDAGGVARGDRDGSGRVDQDHGRLGEAAALATGGARGPRQRRRLVRGGPARFGHRTGSTGRLATGRPGFGQHRDAGVRRLGDGEERFLAHAESRRIRGSSGCVSVAAEATADLPRGGTARRYRRTGREPAGERPGRRIDRRYLLARPGPSRIPPRAGTRVPCVPGPGRQVRSPWPPAPESPRTPHDASSRRRAVQPIPQNFESLAQQRAGTRPFLALPGQKRCAPGQQASRCSP
jgi:hypothetical protein